MISIQHHVEALRPHLAEGTPVRIKRGRKLRTGKVLSTGLQTFNGAAAAAFVQVQVANARLLCHASDVVEVTTP